MLLLERCVHAVLAFFKLSNTGMPCVTVGKVYTCSTGFYFWFCIKSHRNATRYCWKGVYMQYQHFFNLLTLKCHTYSPSFWKPVICNIIAENLFTSAYRSTCFSDCFSLRFQWKNWITEVPDDGCETEWTKLCRKKWKTFAWIVICTKVLYSCLKNKLRSLTNLVLPHMYVNWDP